MSKYRIVTYSWENGSIYLKRGLTYDGFEHPFKALEFLSREIQGPEGLQFAQAYCHNEDSGEVCWRWESR